MTKKTEDLLDALNAQEIERLGELALQLPESKDLFIEEFKKDPEFARDVIESELEKYTETGEIKYLLSTLKDVAAAKGWASLAKETGLSRPTLYETLNGKRHPRIDTLTKILSALGFRMMFVAVDNTKSTVKTTRKRTAKTKKQEKQLQRV